jgi:hypothetical protein
LDLTAPINDTPLGMPIIVDVIIAASQMPIVGDCFLRFWATSDVIVNQATNVIDQLVCSIFGSIPNLFGQAIQSNLDRRIKGSLYELG